MKAKKKKVCPFKAGQTVTVPCPTGGIRGSFVIASVNTRTRTITATGPMPPGMSPGDDLVIEDDKKTT